MTTACRQEQGLVPNHAPGSFVVNATLQNDGKSVLLSWTPAQYPDNDEISYIVAYRGKHIEGIKDMQYLLKNLPFGSDIEGSVIAQEGKANYKVCE